MSILSTVQTVAKNYDEVATKINQMISDNGIVDANDVGDLEITPFGAGMFLCILLFRQYVRWMKQTVYLGAKATLAVWALTRRITAATMGLNGIAPTKKYVAGRLITAAKIGPKMIATRKLGLARKVRLGVLPKAPWKLANGKVKSSIEGLKIIGKKVKLNGATVTWP